MGRPGPPGRRGPPGPSGEEGPKVIINTVYIYIHAEWFINCVLPYAHL